VHVRGRRRVACDPPGRPAYARAARTLINSQQMNGRQVHRMGTFVLSLAMVAIGLALVVQALSASAGSISSRLLLGVLFVAAGSGRWYVEVRRRRGA